MATKLKADFEDMKLKLQLDRSDADIRTKQVRQQNERYIISQRKLLDEGSTIEQNDVAVRMEVALGRLLKQALHDQRAAFAEKMKLERAVLNQSLSKVLEENDANIKKERANVDSMIKQTIMIGIWKRRRRRWAFTECRLVFIFFGDFTDLFS